MIFPQNLLRFEDVPINCPKQFLYYIESISRRACDKKKSNLNSMYLVNFQPSKIWMFFGKFTVEEVLKSFSDRNNSLKPLFFGFGDPYDLEDSIKLWALISWVLGLQAFKTAKKFLQFFACFWAAIMDWLIISTCYFLSRISTSRNIKLIQFFSLFGWFFLILPSKPTAL